MVTALISLNPETCPGSKQGSDAECREDGGPNPLRSEFMVGFEVTEQEVRDLTAFLESLTDQHLLTDHRFSDPWGSNP